MSLPPSAARHVDLTPTGQQRVSVIGLNVCGKSSPFKVLAGTIAPESGICDVPVEPLYLDQGLAKVLPERSVLN